MKEKMMTEDHEVRTLKWRLKQLNKTCSKQGQTIHDLRCELAESREINGKIARGRLRDLEREAVAARARIDELQRANKNAAEYVDQLLDKLDAVAP